MIVKGEDVIVYIYDGTWKPYVCGRSSARTLNTDYIKTSVAGSGKDETIEPTENSATLTVDGIVSLEEAGTLSLADLQAKQEAHEKLLIRREITDTAGHIYTTEGYYYILSSTDTGSYDGLNTFTVDFRRTGSTTVVYTPTNPLNANKVKRYPYTGIGGELDFTDTALIGKDILEVVKDGLGRADIITSGTPVDKEVKYTTSTGNFEFPQTFEAGEKAYVLYQDI